MERTYWYEPRIAPGGDVLAAEAACYGQSMPDRMEVDVEAEPNGFDPAPNLVGSLVVDQEIGRADALHMPVLDFDAVPMRLVPSSTPGNFHLYIDKPILWMRYVPLLEALRGAGLVEAEYVNASIRQGSTFVRPPGVLRLDKRAVPVPVVTEPVA